MKLAKISKLVQHSKQVVLYRLRSGFLLGVPAAWYLVDDLPYIERERELQILLDIPDKRWKGTLAEFKEAEGTEIIGRYNLFGRDATDSPCQEHPYTRGNAIVAMLAEDGRMAFFDRSLLEPLRDLLKEEGENITFHLRETSAGEYYILIYKGMFLQAVLFALTLPQLGDEYIFRLKDYYKCLQAEQARRMLLAGEIPEERLKEGQENGS